MIPDDRPILLLLSALGLRGALTARLGMAGAVVTTGALADPAVERSVEEAGLIVVDEPALSNAGQGEILRRILPGPRTVIVAVDPQNPALACVEGATIVAANQAIDAVLARLEHLRS